MHVSPKSKCPPLLSGRGGHFLFVGGQRPRHPGWVGRGPGRMRPSSWNRPARELESGTPKQNEHREQKSLHRQPGGEGVAVEQALNGIMLNGAMLKARIDRAAKGRQSIGLVRNAQIQYTAFHCPARGPTEKIRCRRQEDLREKSNGVLERSPIEMKSLPRATGQRGRFDFLQL